jgi:hypothetical protein
MLAINQHGTLNAANELEIFAYLNPKNNKMLQCLHPCGQPALQMDHVAY